MMRPRIGISSCLLGERVRYDGGHKRDAWIVDDLGRQVEWVPICPEMAMGLGVPREPIQLVRDARTRELRLRTVKTNKDLSALAETTSRKLLRPDLRLDGYILKKNSPSCDPGTGVFARRLVEKYPDLPVVEEGQLCDPNEREHFIERVFAHARLAQLVRRTSELQKFHQAYKLLIMAHSPEAYQNLGRIAANPQKLSGPVLFEQYAPLLMQALARPAPVGRRINVLHHVLGYFKDRVGAKEKSRILETIEEYRHGEVPYVVPLKLLRDLSRKFDVAYLEGQALFEPCEKEGLRSKTSDPQL